MAVLFALLLGLSSFELALRAEKGKSQVAGFKEKSFKHASTTAFIGILVSISAGVAASTLRSYSILEVIMPVGLLLLWMRFQAEASDSISFKELGDQLDESYRGIIIRTAEKHPRINGDDQLYRECLVQAQEDEAFLREVTNFVGKKAVSAPLLAVQSVFQSFIFPRERFDRLVLELREQKRLQEFLP